MDYRVIKENDLFLVTDISGNIGEHNQSGFGLYTKDTRFLSKLHLKINGRDPILLASDAAENYMAKILLTNPHIEEDGQLILWRESIEMERTRFIYNDVFYESIKVKNYHPKSVQFDVSLQMDADFADMFIVRGFQTGKVGSRKGQTVSNKSLRFLYEGADQLHRETIVTWDKEEKAVDEQGNICFDFELEHLGEDTVTVMIQPKIGVEPAKTPLEFSEALKRLKQSYHEWNENITRVTTDHEPLQRLVDRGIMDLRVLLTDLGYGKFPVAGLPWFGVPFGRDSLIAALQMLPFNPEVAKGTLLTLAQYQGTKVDPWRDEQPGKIMHEIRSGELANTNQIPFTPYYGTIDATPLFLILATEYIRWTGDLELFEKLSENIESALHWIEQYGDRDGDLFVEYHQESSKGIANQGWKDSGDSIVHRNGAYAKTPIALSEVQGYVYQAKMGLAEVYESLGKNERAFTLREHATKLKEKFETAFWMEDVQFYAIALDGNKQQVGTITSNPGHLLFSGMISPERVDAVVDMLVSPQMFSGYGIRTMGADEAGYNPISYHDGSVWPHDNSMILLGLSKLEKNAAANLVIEGLIDASSYFEYDRLPELFCGYEKSAGKAVKYPVACSPQAWAAGTPLIFVQSILGLFPNSLVKQIFLSPKLLKGMNYLEVRNLAIGSGVLSVRVTPASTEIIENTTGYEVILHRS